MRATRNLAFVAIIAVVIVSLSFSSVTASGVLSSNSGQEPLTDSASKMNSRHVLHAGFWRIDGGFVSTIRVKNILVVAPIDINPTLFMADGTEYPLPPVRIPAYGVATISINDGLAAAPL